MGDRLKVGDAVRVTSPQDKYNGMIGTIRDITNGDGGPTIKVAFKTGSYRHKFAPDEVFAYKPTELKRISRTDPDRPLKVGDEVRVTNYQDKYGGMIGTVSDISTTANKRSIIKVAFKTGDYRRAFGPNEVFAYHLHELVQIPGQPAPITAAAKSTPELGPQSPSNGGPSSNPGADIGIKRNGWQSLSPTTQIAAIATAAVVVTVIAVVIIVAVAMHGFRDDASYSAGQDSGRNWARVYISMGGPYGLTDSEIDSTCREFVAGAVRDGAIWEGGDIAPGEVDRKDFKDGCVEAARAVRHQSR